MRNLAVECRVRGNKLVGRAHDLTREGCLLDTGNGFIRVGEYVSLRFPCGVRLSGRVTMLHGRITRVEFEQPLHEAILSHLASGNGGPVASVQRRAPAAPSMTSNARRVG